MRGCAVGGGGTKPITLTSETIAVIKHGLSRQHYDGFQLYDPTGDDPVLIDPHVPDQIDSVAYRFRFYWNNYFWRLNDSVRIGAEKENSSNSRETRYGNIKEILVINMAGYHVPVVGIHMATIGSTQSTPGSLALKLVQMSNTSSPPLTYWLWENVERPVTLYPKTGEATNNSFWVLDFERPYKFTGLHERWLQNRFLKIGSIIRVNGDKSGGSEWIAGT